MCVFALIFLLHSRILLKIICVTLKYLILLVLLCLLLNLFNECFLFVIFYERRLCKLELTIICLYCFFSTNYYYLFNITTVSQVYCTYLQICSGGAASWCTVATETFLMKLFHYLQFHCDNAVYNILILYFYDLIFINFTILYATSNKYTLQQNIFTIFVTTHKLQCFTQKIIYYRYIILIYTVFTLTIKIYLQYGPRYLIFISLIFLIIFVLRISQTVLPLYLFSFYEIKYGAT